MYGRYFTLIYIDIGFYANLTPGTKDISPIISLVSRPQSSALLSLTSIPPVDYRIRPSTASTGSNLLVYAAYLAALWYHDEDVGAASLNDICDFFNPWLERHID